VILALSFRAMTKKIHFLIISFFFLTLFFNPSYAQEQGQPKTDLLFIIDSSGSMASLLEGQRMIDWAKKAVKSAAAQLPPEAYAGLRVYSHRIDKSNKEASCKDTELVVPISSGTGSLIAASADKLEPRGWTPIAYTLSQVEADFNQNVEKLHTIILVSDGEETCGGDPAAVMRALVAKGYKFKLCTVGFNVEDVAKQQLMALASEFGCTYTDVRSGMSLEQELAKLTQQSFLIEKKVNPKNQIRGGDSFNDAVPIETNKRYSLDHHQRKDQYDYFSFKLKQGEAVSLRVFPVEKCLDVVGDQATERASSSCDYDGLRYVLMDGQQKELERLSFFLVNKQHETDFYTSSAPGETLYYLIIGSPYDEMHKDHEFILTTKQGTYTVTGSLGDANTNNDAGDNFSTAIVLSPGIYENNSVSKMDQVDVFKVVLKEPSLVKLVGTHVKKSDYADIDFEILDELGAVLGSQDLSEGNSYSFQPQSPLSGAIYLRVKIDSVIVDSDTVNYSMGVSVSPAPVELIAKAVEKTPPQKSSVEEVDEMEEVVLDIVPSPQKFTLWLGLVALAFALFAGLYVFFFVVRKKVAVDLFSKILGWYEIFASIIGMGTAIWLATKQPSLAWQIVLLVMLGGVGLLGIIAGGNLLLNKGSKLSFIWGGLQAPWIYLNLHWVVVKYSLSLFWGLPVYFFFETSQNPIVNVQSKMHLGALFGLWAQFLFPGRGMGIGLGVNLAAVLFLGLLYLNQRKKTN